MRRLPLLLLFLALVISAGDSGSANKDQPLPVVLKASEVFFNDVLAMTTGTYKGERRFYVFHKDSFIIYNEDRSILSKVETSGNFSPVDPVVDSKGNVYLINSATPEIAVLGPDGKWVGSFRVQEWPYSLARLGNGNIVIASPSHGKLLHIYSASGRKLRSFGDIKFFDVTNEAQNLFLNIGKVVVDSSDNIYYVFKYAPTPAFLKFSSKGKFISESAIEGYAVNLQVEAARNYLSTKPTNEVGSIVITNSAAIDPSTGNLWICMNGSSKSGVVYEYSRKGKKLREYSFVVDIPSGRPNVLTYVTDILAETPSVYIRVGNGVYSVSSNQQQMPSDFVVSAGSLP